MEIDAIQIEFSQDTALIMNICIAFLMFGVALDMKISDFKRVAQFPRSVAVGLSSQLILLPLLTVVLILLWKPIPSMALGLVLIAACPGGNISNYAVHLAKGNTALSITLTSIVTLSAIFITPTTFALWSKLVPSTQPILERISLNPLDMVWIIFQLIIAPLAIGMWLNHNYGNYIRQLKKPIKNISLALFSAFIFFAVFANFDRILEYLRIVFVLVVIHNLIALIAGYYFARGMGRSRFDAKAICMETGIQNAGIGLVIILNFFSDLGGMMLVAAFWGVWDLFSAYILALIWNKRTRRAIE